MQRKKPINNCTEFILTVSVLFLAGNMNAQHNKPVVRDTLSVYKKIKRIAYKTKPTKLLYHAVFVDPAPLKYEEKPLSDQQKVEDPNARYVGKYIRNIYVQVYDPFGYSVNDTTGKITNPFQKLGNRYHITTRHRIIRNLLLFKPDDCVDILKFTESERILRETRYINDARIYIINASENSDFVDVKVVVHDRWTLDAPVSGGVTGGHITLRDRNVLGLGQAFAQYVGYAIPDKFYDLKGVYSVSNIRRSFISSTMAYETNPDATTIGVSVDRPFFSPLALWAGGISSGKTWGTYKYTDSLGSEVPVVKRLPLSSMSYDAWVATSFKPGIGKKKNRRVSGIILAYRYAGTTFQSRPSFSIDTNKLNYNYSLYLGSVGYSLSKFYKDQYIFRFGANEDIPEGLVIQFLYGAIRREDIGWRYYNGVVLARGKHFGKIGYISVKAAYGTFYNKNVTNDATLNLNLMYFTNLYKTPNKWYFRQFVYHKYVYGINKQPYDKITLLPSELYGFNNGSLLGSSKMLLNLESVFYAPYNLIGFKVAPVILLGFGMLETKEYKLFRGQVYQAYAVGLLIRNENLLSSSFEISYGLYPNLPDGNKHFYKFNPTISFQVKIDAFEIAKPETVRYQ